MSEGCGFGPDRRRNVIVCLVCLLLGGVGLTMQWQRHLRHLADPAHGAGASLLLMLAEGTLLCAGLALLAGMLVGLPRLSADASGLVLTGLFGTRSVRWTDLGPLLLGPRIRGRWGLSQQQARAEMIVRTMGGGARLSSLVLTDRFDVPLVEILRTLDTLRDGRVNSRLLPMDHVAYGAEEVRHPWLTVAMLILLLGIFALEIRVEIAAGGKASQLRPATLFALGALNPARVQAGDWFRLLTAPLLHGGIGHLVANAIAFALAGYALEKFVGRAWMFTIFAAGALAGSAVSLQLLPAGSTSVGASGAIMAMLVAMFIVTFRLPAGRTKYRLQRYSAAIAIPTLLPVGGGAAGVVVDYGAHFGGALIGAILGLLLLAGWQRDAPTPGARPIALAFSALALMAFGASAVALGRHSAAVTGLPRLIPPQELPSSQDGLVADAYHLLLFYPDDPRSHLAVAVKMAQQGDAPSAEAQFRTALSLAERNEDLFTPVLRNDVRMMLATTVLLQGRADEAREIAQEACTASGAEAPTLTPFLVTWRPRLCPPAAGR